MERQELMRLKETALRVRESIIGMSRNGGAFAGSALSCADLLVYLYGSFLRVRPDLLDDPSRDYLFLSKGHAVPALYAALAEAGILEKERLKNHLTTADDIYWHPNRGIPGVEFHAGSLGHLVPVATGVALDCKMREGRNRVVVIVGDGELNEGSNWEGFLVARALGLENLIIVVDRNRVQANRKTESLLPLEPLDEKFRSFGLATMIVDGHDFRDIERAFQLAPFELGSPSVVIAETIRGKGVPSLEYRIDRWFCNFTEEEAEGLIGDLRAASGGRCTPETAGVR